MAHSRSFLANQKARNAIFGAENLLIANIEVYDPLIRKNRVRIFTRASKSANSSQNVRHFARGQNIQISTVDAIRFVKNPQAIIESKRNKRSNGTLLLPERLF